MNVFAAFIVARVPGGFAATTRAADRGEAGRIGLPGGKLEPGETPEAAAVREALEEGWRVEGELTPILDQEVEGRLVRWFEAPVAEMIRDHKEAGRIEPFIATARQLAESGYGNDVAIQEYWNRFFKNVMLDLNGWGFKCI